MTRRYLVTLTDDPALAAQAHAAILALPGVEGVEVVPGPKRCRRMCPAPGDSAASNLRVREYAPTALRMLPDGAEARRENTDDLWLKDGTIWRWSRPSGEVLPSVTAPPDDAFVQMPICDVCYGTGYDVTAPPPYTVADEDDGAP